MSETTLEAAPSSGAAKVLKINEAVIRIAGNSQDGIQAIGGFLARLAGRSEQEVMTFMTIPSTISGGPSIFQVRIGCFTPSGRMNFSFGVRWHVTAFPLGDMSPSSKARTCPRTPNEDTTPQVNKNGQHGQKKSIFYYQQTLNKLINNSAA